MRKTFATNAQNIKKEYVFINAENQILGKVAEQAAKTLMGKSKPQLAPNINIGDKVVITNSAKVAITGRKKENKVYYHHTGYPKGLRAETLGSLMERNSTEVIRRAIKGMLPKNKLRDDRMANLYIYEGDEHPYKAQEK